MTTWLLYTIYLILIGNKYIFKKIDGNLIICILNRKYILI